ncbi:MAG: hypothetical protein LBJ46_05635 [Planctomycetota bacterium]|nr:hypothetical protein [Planctomycetota bacterium]
MITDKERLILKIFYDYYVRNMSQTEIAARHFISRPRVQRYLEQGRRDNLVEVRIRFPERMHGTLESELEDKLGLSEAFVADTGSLGDLAMARREIAEIAADFFLRVLSGNMVISVSWSTFISEMTGAVQRKTTSRRESAAMIEIVQCMGAIMDKDPELQVFDSLRRLAAALNARPHLIGAPGVVTSNEAYNALLDDPQVAASLDLARRSDAGFFGIGALEGESNLMRAVRRLFPELPSRLKKMGVVGDMNGRFFDRSGLPVASELDNRVIGLTLAEVKALPLSVVVTGGDGKYEALRAVVRGGLAKAVVIDYDNARRLVEDRSAFGGGNG